MEDSHSRTSKNSLKNVLSAFSFQGTERRGKENAAVLTFLTRDDIVGSEVLVEDTEEGTADDGDFLVEGVAGGVDEGVNEVRLADGIGCRTELTIDGEEFVAVIGELLEGYAFRMTKVEKIEGFGKWGEKDFLMVIVGKEDAVVSSDDKRADTLAAKESFTNCAKAHTALAKLLEAFVDLINQAK